jgi:Fe-S-cluster-containing dehydrogenase component
MKVFVIDSAKCNGCRNCQIACKDEHCDNDWLPYAKAQPDTGHFWLKLDETIRGQVPKVVVSYVAKLCQHCGNAACEDICKQEAFVRREDGLLVLDPNKCTGCQDCVDACPYGAIFWNSREGIAQKCTGCSHLLDDGWDVPHCVDVCPHDAIRFGDIEYFAAEISNAEALIPNNNHDPHVYYLNLPKRFIASIVVDIEADEVLIGTKVTLENLNSGEVQVTETDEFGDFWFRQIPAALYRLYFEHDGYMTRAIETSTIERDQSIAPIALYADRQI